jgi:hypothetical protein
LCSPAPIGAAAAVAGKLAVKSYSGSAATPTILWSRVNRSEATRLQHENFNFGVISGFDLWR